MNKELLYRDGTPMRKYNSPIISELVDEIKTDEMNKELFDKLDKINDTIFDMDIKVKRINEMLEELIAALHEYDDENISWDKPNDALKEAAEQYKAKVKPCVGHDAASWDEERIDIIGQNGNEGTHYESMEELNDEFFGKIVDDGFDDYGKRVEKNKSNNIQPKQKQYWKNKRSKRAENKK